MIEMLMYTMLLWMGLNCNVDNLHSVHNPCQYNYNIHPPRVVFLSQKNLQNEFYGRGSIAVGNGKKHNLYGFYRIDEEIIFLDNKWDEERANDLGTLFHELYHHVQLKNKVNLFDCMAYREVPAALFTKKYVKSLGLDQNMHLYMYDSSCNIYYNGI
jgi:hypothetical protein